MILRTISRASLCAIVASALCASALLGCSQQPSGADASPAQSPPSITPGAVAQSPGGSSAQKFFVDPSNGYWNPDVVDAEAGKPIDITFGKGTYECSNGLTFAAFGVDTAVSLAQGPVTLHSDGLPAGTYPWLCSMQGMCGGRLVVH
jgi:hypothetical protein